MHNSEKKKMEKQNKMKKERKE